MKRIRRTPVVTGVEKASDQWRTPPDLFAFLHDEFQFTRWAAEIREIPHRVNYLKADGTSKAGAMFSSAIVVFRPQPGVRRGQPRRVTWSWRPEVNR